MPVQGAASQSVFSSEVGTIGTTWTFTAVEKFSPAQNVLAVPLLRYIYESDDQTVTEAFVSQFTDGGVSKTGHFMGVAAAHCSQITWAPPLHIGTAEVRPDRRYRVDLNLKKLVEA